MTTHELRRAGEELLTQAASIRALFPNAAAMRAVALSELPRAELLVRADRVILAALAWVRCEAEEARAGHAWGVGALDAEIAFARYVLAFAASPAVMPRTVS